jgi:hypothetical protein
MREALFQDQVASKFKRGTTSVDLMVVDTIEEGLVSQIQAQQQPDPWLKNPAPLQNS